MKSHLDPEQRELVKQPLFDIFYQAKSTGFFGLKGIVHYFTMSTWKEKAVYGHHNVAIISFLT